MRKFAEIISRSPRHGFKLILDSRSDTQTQPHPDVHPFAAYLGERFECTHLITVGRPSARDLMQLYPRFEIIGIVPGGDLKSYRDRYGFATWLDENLQCEFSRWLPENLLKHAIIICTDAMERFENSPQFLQSFKRWLDHAPLCILTTPDQTLGGLDQTAVEQSLRAKGFKIEFIGLTATDNAAYEKKSIMAVIRNHGEGKATLASAPDDFRVVAFMAAYNEEDIIVQSIRKWTDQGIHVHVLENWSTDATYDLAKQMEHELPVTVERFPTSGPSRYFDWEAMLARIEVLSREIEAHWFIRRGADEVLCSPWPGLSYKDSLYLVDQAGFNCVDHTIVEFYPVDNGFKTGMDHEAYFKHFDFKHLSHPFQRKAWKNYGQSISTIPSAGHDVIFAGRRVYPFKFLLKHYSFRSQKHGETKVFRERKARWNPAERARGWHVHYDAVQEGHQFVHATSEKEVFNECDFNNAYLVERLSGIGVDR